MERYFSVEPVVWYTHRSPLHGFNHSMPSRPCLDCGTITSGSRCPDCRATQQRRTDQRRGTTAERGYNATWQRLVAQAMSAQRAQYGEAHCVDCDITEQQGRHPSRGHPSPEHT